MADIHSKRRSTCHGAIIVALALSQMSGIFSDLFESIAFSVAPRSCPMITAVRNQPLNQDAKAFATKSIGLAAQYVPSATLTSSFSYFKTAMLILIGVML